MLHRSTLQLLRFHFSFFLLPVFLFALSQVDEVDWFHALYIFLILHLLVYPSSNGYNSYMDRDTTPIGGLKNPLQPTRQLFHVTIIMDISAISLGFFISLYFAVGVLLYILASRAYSYRGIRLKKYPVTGYLVVIIFQGALVFFISYHGCSMAKTLEVPVLPMMGAALLIGGSYPLTQIFQHEEDLRDGVRTVSYVLGKRGTFIFCGAVFALATLCMFLTFLQQDKILMFLVFLACMFPVVWFFSFWFRKVWLDEKTADFNNSFRMNVLASTCTTVCFTILALIKHLE